MGQIIFADARARSRGRPPPGWTAMIVPDTSALGERWSIIGATGASTAFQSREWLDAWYTAARDAGTEPVIVAADKASGGCAMILPLALSKLDGQRVVAFADLGVSDYNAPILGPDAPQDSAQVQALWAVVKRALPPADLLFFEKMPRCIAGRTNPLLWLGDGLSSQTQSACRLAEPWHLARQRLMPKEFRDSLDGRRRKLSRKATVEFRLAANKDEAAAFFATLVRQKAERSLAMGWHNILSEAPWQAFYRRLALQGVDGGMARLMALIVNGEPASVILGLERHGRFYDLLTSFDAGKWKRHSPGLLALDDAMGLMAGRGVEVYDLTIGAEGYKDHFGPEAEPLHEYAEALSWRGMAAAMALRAKGAVRRNPRLARFARSMVHAGHATSVTASHLAANTPVGVVGTAAGL